jgi:hypothetical protein
MSGSGRCGRCARWVDEAAWRRLELVERFEPTSRVVLAWPAGDGVEVRRCAGCGSAMARKVERVST